VDNKTEGKRQVIGLVGVGLDNEDGETRITRNEDMLVVGGSPETHERLQDLSIKFNASLKERGKQLQEAEVKEVIDLLRRALGD
jgi:hypothetical protein